MPDEPTSTAGDSGVSSATFRGRVERVDETTPGAPAVTSTIPASGPATSSERPAAPVPAARPTTGTPSRRPGRARARKVRRVVRHIDPWSVLKLSVLFYAALFLIICVASAILWGAARSSGTIDNVESFITSVGGFGNCEPVDGASTPSTTTTTLPGASASTGPVDQIDPGGTDVSVTEPDGAVADPGDDEDCPAGEELVGAFKFEDVRIFQAFALGGIVLVLAGSAANVVLVLLFNLMSDLTGGVRVTVLEEEPPARAASGSPAGAKRG